MPVSPSGVVDSVSVIPSEGGVDSVSVSLSEGDVASVTVSLSEGWSGFSPSEEGVFSMHQITNQDIIL